LSLGMLGMSGSRPCPCWKEKPVLLLPLTIGQLSISLLCWKRISLLARWHLLLGPCEPMGKPVVPYKTASNCLRVRALCSDAPPLM
jgi:hypothetical protein